MFLSRRREFFEKVLMDLTLRLVKEKDKKREAMKIMEILISHHESSESKFLNTSICRDLNGLRQHEKVGDDIWISKRLSELRQKTREKSFIKVIWDSLNTSNEELLLFMAYDVQTHTESCAKPNIEHNKKVSSTIIRRVQSLSSLRRMRMVKIAQKHPRTRLGSLVIVSISRGALIAVYELWD